MKTVKLGDRGEPVIVLQKALKLYPDGIFGKLTEEAVKEFQKANSLTADGVVGSKTWAILSVPSALEKSSRTINEIIVHCSATKEGQDFTVDDIAKWHKQRGFNAIGYHYVVYRDGSVHNGRSVNISGAHCTGHNTHSIGICYIGGLDSNGKAKDTRTDEQKASLLSLLKDLHKLYPKAKIIGHRDVSPDKNGNGTIEPFEWIKECPSFDAKNEYKPIN